MENNVKYIIHDTPVTEDCLVETFRSVSNPSEFFTDKDEMMKILRMHGIPAEKLKPEEVERAQQYYDIIRALEIGNAFIETELGRYIEGEQNGYAHTLMQQGFLAVKELGWK